MASLILRARIFDDDDNPVQRHAVTVETFDLSARQWQTLIETSTDAKGGIEQRIDLGQVATGKVGPALRLVEPGDPPRVLSPGPMLRIDARTRDVIADFGEIERLDDTGFARIDTRGASRDTVAGLARKKGLAQSNIMRNIALNPNIGTIVGRSVSQPAAPIAVREPAARAEMDPAIAAEIETMRALNIDSAAKLSEKDRIIATREHELGLKDAALKEAVARAAAAETKARTAVEESNERAKAAAVGLQADTKAVGKEADIQSVFTGIGAKLGETQTVLKASKNPFRIGNIRVDLKGALAEEGKIVLGADRGDGSGVSVDMAPDTGGPDDATVTVPDVSGLTLSAARRVLRSVGLRSRRRHRR